MASTAAAAASSEGALKRRTIIHTTYLYVTGVATLQQADRYGTQLGRSDRPGLWAEEPSITDQSIIAHLAAVEGWE